jgi:hypothetical protein
VLEDGSVGINQPGPAHQLDVNGDAAFNGPLYLPAPATIYTGSSRLLRSDGNQDFFAGLDAGARTTGSFCTAIGYQALNSNTNGFENTAVGYQALFYNFAAENTACGKMALFNNTTGGRNSALGYHALHANSTGFENVGLGAQSLYQCTTGVNNIGIGVGGGYNVTTGSFNIEIGNAGTFTDNGAIRIGTTAQHTSAFIAGIYGSTAASGVQVYINSSGQLGTLTSSARYKDHIQSMDDASDVLLSLRPVTFKYKHEIDPDGIPQFGLVAEEVAKIDPDLVARDDHGQIYTVRYQAVSAMLLNEFLKQHEKVVAQNDQIQTLTQQNQALATRLDHLEQMMRSMSDKK